MGVTGRKPVRKEDFEAKKLIPSDVWGFKIDPTTKRIYAYVGDDLDGKPVEVGTTKYQMKRLERGGS